MRLVVFTLGDPANIGGVQQSTARLSDHLVGQGHTVFLYTHFDVAPELHAHKCMRDVGWRVYRQADTAANRAEILEQVGGDRPDVVLIINSSQTAGVIVSALQSLNVPLILSERGAPETILRYNWACRVQRDVIHSMCAASHVLMESFAASLPMHRQARVAAIPSAVPLPDDADVDAITAREKTILWVGRMTFEKDVPHLLRAFAMVRDRFPDWTLKLVGDGSDRADIERLIDALGIGDGVVLTGALGRDEVETAYRDASVFVLPSRSEGCPLALGEAMGWRMPVIGFADCPGTNEIIRNGQNGFLVAGGDRALALSEALASLLADEAEQLRLGRQARLDAMKYSLERVHEDWESFLSAVAAKRHKRQASATGERLYGLRLAVLARRLRRTGNTRNLLTHKAVIPVLAFRKRAVRRTYLGLFGLPVFDFKAYYEAHPDVKQAGGDALLDYVSGSSGLFAPDIIERGVRSEAMTAADLVDLWQRYVADPSVFAPPAGERNEWERAAVAERERGARAGGVLRFLRFYARRTVWARESVG